MNEDQKYSIKCKTSPLVVVAFGLVSVFAPLKGHRAERLRSEAGVAPLKGHLVTFSYD